MTSTATAVLFPTPPFFTPKYSSSLLLTRSILPFPSLKPKPLHFPLTPTLKPSFLVRVDDGDGDADPGGPSDYDADEEEVELDNTKDFEVEYDPLEAASVATASATTVDVDIAIIESKSFVSTQGWDSDMVVDYRINEEEFHKISLLDCDFFIRKPPDPDNDVYDFREVFLTKHYRNRRLSDPEFVLDFEEIYVIDSKTKSITRAKVLVTVPGGRNRDRKSDLLVIRDNGNSFKIIHASERDDPTTVIEREEWAKSRQDMERHLRKLRDFNISNWF
ncbi:uncharacterized protein LOC111312256 isoform X3 [Durio zibethinus]|uniref:Uncharacterized protein LOC111312256 isoform X3 n=1 Tax=Durio zibethinus TaxID=66656 RepID=A0A6P6AT66_DURZI|nr:uncharacterized protein LOC111312256 isoform X3 [Durio zibethinus]